MDFLIFKAPMLMVQASLDGILLGILFALIAYGMALQWGVMNIINICLLYTSPSPRDGLLSRMPSSA